LRVAAAALFEQTARGYGRSGRQSWVWYQRSPDAARLWEYLGVAGERLRRTICEIILLGLDDGGRHAETVRFLRQKLSENGS
jgi:hypothetical protein